MKHAGQGKPKKRRKRAVAITAYTLVVLFAVGLIELLLRIAMPQLSTEGWSAGVFCYNRACDYRAMVPNAISHMQGLEFTKVTLEANSNGYRGSEWPIDDSVAVVLGDSFGWGWGVPDSATWLRHLHEPTDVPAINLSMPGDDWFRMQHRFRLHQRDLKVKRLVVLCYINDFFRMDDQLARRDSLNQTGFYGRDHVVLDGCETVNHTGRFYPFNRLYLYKLVKGVYLYFSQRNTGERMSDYHTRIGYNDDAAFLNLNSDFRSVCSEYRAALLEAAGKLPVTLVYIPPVYAIDSAKAGQVSKAASLSLPRYTDFYTVFSRSLDGLPNVQFVDLHPSLSRAHAESSVYFLDDGHLNAHGHRVLGECVSAAIHPHPTKKGD